MTKKYELKIDITDWAEETIEIEPELIEQDDIVKLVTEQGMSTSKAASVAIAARHLGFCPETLLITDKLLLHTGARGQINSMLKVPKKKVKLESGKQIAVRSYVGKPKTKEGVEDENENEEIETEEEEFVIDGPDFVQSDTEQGTRRAYKYLFSNVPGYIRGRLAILAANGEDIKGAIEHLKDLMDNMLEDFV